MKFPTALQTQDELAGLYEAPTDIYGMMGINESATITVMMERIPDFV